jgi:sugar transferase (PEP-CTERM/EpsH1 system associated)
VRILFITDYLPYPLISGDRIRVYHLIRRIANQHQVWLAALLETPSRAKDLSHLGEFCQAVETAYWRRRHPLAHLPGLLRFALKGTPLELKFVYSEELTRKISQLVSKVDFDIVEIQPSNMAIYLEALPVSARCKCVLTFHNIGFQQFARISRYERRLGRKMRALLFSWMMRRWEPRYAERFDCCATVSEVDRDLLMMANSRLQVEVIPNGVDTHLYQPLPYEGTTPALMFVGNMDYPPNIDAVVFFCQEVFPHIRRMIPDVEVWIIGTSPAPEVRQLDGSGVHVTGQVEDIVPYYERSAICVVPLRAGGGTRLKILEAMALGRPVVSTSVGAEGLNVVDGQHLLIADSPEQLTEKTVLLLTEREVYQHIVTNARKLVVTWYDWDVVAGRLMQVYADLMA